MPPASPRFIHSLRFKLLLASLTLLVIPWIGYRYLLEVEESLRQAQETLLLSRAEVVANLMAVGDAEKGETGEFASLSGNRPSLYVYPLSQQILLDGYTDDWIDLLNQARRYSASEISSQAVSFELLCGYQRQYLYLLIRVEDNTLTYPTAGESVTTGDHLLLALPGEGGVTQQYLLGTSAPGWLSIVRRETGTVENALHGEWQESPGGYTVELRLPRQMAEGGLSLAVIDLDKAGGRPVGIASTSGWQSNDRLARLVTPSLPSTALLEGLDSHSHRYTILNRQRQIIGRYGNVSSAADTPSSALSRLLSFLLSLQPAAGDEEREHAGRMDGPEIRQALEGKGAIHRYQSQGSKRMTLSAAYPLLKAGEVTGVILVEQTTRDILLLQQHALERLLVASLLLFLITGGSLLLLATYLTRRITLLNRKFNQAVSADGRVIQSVVTPPVSDELGALDRGFSTVLQRLQAYNHYLEALASRLAHEFRTPLAMVQSSLENLHMDDNPESRRYAQRALEGTQRLHLILNRLREATRLEQALQSTTLSPTDLTALCRSLCEGYSLSQPSLELVCRLPETPLTCQVSPELISQALDKLVSNAIDFHLPGTPVSIELSRSGGSQVRLSVSNQGPPLPAEMHEALFESMVSLRDRKGDEPHLGLGLYLVRLIAEFHQGSVAAEDIEGGVRFSILLPCAA